MFIYDNGNIANCRGGSRRGGGSQGSRDPPRFKICLFTTTEISQITGVDPGEGGSQGSRDPPLYMSFSKSRKKICTYIKIRLDANARYFRICYSLDTTKWCIWYFINKKFLALFFFWWPCPFSTLDPPLNWVIWWGNLRREVVSFYLDVVIFNQMSSHIDPLQVDNCDLCTACRWWRWQW